jgi:hypothetical protein
MESIDTSNESSLQDALISARALHGPEHYSVAYRLMQLGNFFEKQKRLAEAEKAYLGAADIYRCLGADHELLCAIALKAADSVMKLQGNFAVTERINGEVLSIIENHRLID